MEGLRVEWGSVDSFLDQMSDGGEFDSDGVFTVHRSKARSKLAQYQLVNFHDFPDFLISAATVAGARAIRVDYSGRSLLQSAWTRIEIQGWSLSPEELESLQVRELETERLEAQKYLMIALSALVTREPVLIVSQGEFEGCAYRMHYQQVEPVTDIDLKLLSANTLVLEMRHELEPDLSSRFEERSVWCPLALSIGDRVFPQGISYLAQLDPTAIYWVDGDRAPKVRIDEQVAGRTFRGESGSEQPKLLTLLPKSDCPFFVMVDGIPYPAPEEFRLPHVGGYIVGNHLKRDLSFQGLVKNRELLESVREFRESVASLLIACCEQPDSIEESLVMGLRLLIGVLARDFDLSRAERGLFQRSGGLTATTNAQSLNSLIWKLPMGSHEEQDRLLRDYRQLAGAHFEAGQSLEARAALQASLKCREHLERSQEWESSTMGLLTLFRWEKEMWPLSERHKPFIDRLDGWTGGAPWLDLHGIECHPSWRTPLLFQRELETGTEMEAGNEKVPDWLRLWRLLANKRVEEALEFLPSSDFYRKSDEREWLELLWARFRGRVAFTTAVKLRVKLSFARTALPPFLPVDKQLTPYYALRYWQAPAHPWPLFFWHMTERLSGEGDWVHLTREVWRHLVIRRMLQLSFSDQHHRDPLGGPFELEF